MIKRKSCHKKRCVDENNKKHNSKIYQTIRNNGGWANWTIIEIEKFSCLDANEARARERYWYEILNSILNSILPQGHNLEQYNINKQQYRDNHKEERKIYDKKCYQENKEKIKLKSNIYRNENKEKILAKEKEKFECCCGAIIRINGKSRHFKSAKHLAYLATL